MLQQIRFAFASVLACAMFAGCIGAPEEAEEVGDEEVGTAEQQLPSSGFQRTYYSDSSRTTAVGTEIRDCEPDYNDSWGEKTNFYNEFRWPCPVNPYPFAPYTVCYDCYRYTYPDGTSFISCNQALCAN